MRLFQRRPTPRRVGELVNLDEVGCVEDILEFHGLYTDDSKFPQIPYHPRTSIRDSKFGISLYNATPHGGDESAETKIGKAQIRELDEYRKNVKDPATRGWLESYYGSILGAAGRLYRLRRYTESRLADVKARKTRSQRIVGRLGRGVVALGGAYIGSRLSGSAIDQMEFDVGGVRVRGSDVNLVLSALYFLGSGYVINKVFKTEEQEILDEDQINAGTIHTHTVIEVTKEAGRFFPGFLRVDPQVVARRVEESEPIDSGE